MSRLTYRDEHGNARLFQETLRRNPYAFAEKMCHYEDLEEAGRLIELDDSLPARDELDRCTHRHCNNCDKYRLELQLYKDNDKRIKQMIGMDMAEASARFASDMKMKAEGRLTELPCKVGDTVWNVNEYAEGFKIRPMKACCIVVKGNNKKYVYLEYTDTNDYLEHGYGFDDFGHVLFLTKAEAEAKLAELKEGAK